MRAACLMFDLCIMEELIDDFCTETFNNNENRKIMYTSAFLANLQRTEEQKNDLLQTIDRSVLQQEEHEHEDYAYPNSPSMISKKLQPDDYDEVFIEAVRNNPIIWAVGSRNYKNTEKKNGMASDFNRAWVRW